MMLDRRTLLVVALLALGLLLTLGATSARAQSSLTLVQTLDSSQWNPPSPDPSGITYWPARDALVVVDGEVEEMTIYAGVNLWVVTRQGSILHTGTTTAFSDEPVGVDIALNPSNDHFYISDDSRDRVFEVDPGADGLPGTGDDTVHSFSTGAFGSGDPEGLTFGTVGGAPRLFIADGAGRRVFVVSPGGDGLFNGVPPEGDDSVTSFDTYALGIRDSEGIEFDAARGTLLLVDRRRDNLVEVTPGGALVQVTNLGFLNPVALSDLTFAPSSVEPGVLNLFVTDRGVDNNHDPTENDGKIFEIAFGAGSPPPSPTPTPSPTLTPPATTTPPSPTPPPPTPTATATPPPGGELLRNGSFEQDANGDGLPDDWRNDPHFTRSAALVAAGSYAGLHAGSGNSSYVVFQRVEGVTAGQGYALACQLNIPPNDDNNMVFKLELRWRDAGRSLLRTDLAVRYKRPTAGWERVTLDTAAPAGSAMVDVRMVVKRLDSLIYVDDCHLSPGP